MAEVAGLEGNAAAVVHTAIASLDTKYPYKSVLTEYYFGAAEGEYLDKPRERHPDITRPTLKKIRFRGTRLLKEQLEASDHQDIIPLLKRIEDYYIGSGRRNRAPQLV